MKKKDPLATLWPNSPEGKRGKKEDMLYEIALLKQALAQTVSQRNSLKIRLGIVQDNLKNTEKLIERGNGRPQIHPAVSIPEKVTR